ncbi:DNA-binding protein HU [Stratiformator vulcanicus]|uniref:DNA-binding protein HU n=1 Tax=Stratiformator vulcanicus TaxID=2527980 RepID=A0A517QYU9_9PLAN|nr:HU family DNA-binding protein [Stratiformator vulcanicus]QDT36720.1 DNA-binding protein HU [Stratiformator vulcanicus]
MTKKEIVKSISDDMGLTQLKTKEIVQRTFDAIVETLVTEGRIELRNFGVFEVKKRAARRARNPRTGERVDVSAKYVVTFKPGKEMEEKVLLLEEEDARREREAAQKGAEPPQSRPEAERPRPESGNQYGSSGHQPPLNRPSGMPPSYEPPRDVPEKPSTPISPMQQPSFARDGDN